MRIKLELTKLLYKRGYTRQQILELFRFIDWVMELPQELDEAFTKAIHEFEEAKKVQYISSIERRGLAARIITRINGWHRIGFRASIW